MSRAVVEAGRRSEEDSTRRRIATGVVLGALLLVLAAGVALAVLEVGNNDGQDTLFGLGADDKLVGKSAADQLVGGSGPDLLEGNDTLVGGGGRDRIFTGGGFDLVFAFDGNRDYINCNGVAGSGSSSTGAWTGSTAAQGQARLVPAPRPSGATPGARVPRCRWIRASSTLDLLRQASPADALRLTSRIRLFGCGRLAHL